jgi:hypothetical protein
MSAPTLSACLQSTRSRQRSLRHLSTIRSIRPSQIQARSRLGGRPDFHFSIFDILTCGNRLAALEPSRYVRGPGRRLRPEGVNGGVNRLVTDMPKEEQSRQIRARCRPLARCDGIRNPACGIQRRPVRHYPFQAHGTCVTKDRRLALGVHCKNGWMPSLLSGHNRAMASLLLPYRNETKSSHNVPKWSR